MEVNFLSLCDTVIENWGILFVFQQSLPNEHTI